MSNGVDFSFERKDMLIKIRLLATLYNLRLVRGLDPNVTHFNREFELQTERSR